jgi:hypothetical protein
MLFQVLFSDDTWICSARNEIDGIDGNDLNGNNNTVSNDEILTFSQFLIPLTNEFYGDRDQAYEVMHNIRMTRCLQLIVE